MEKIGTLTVRCECGSDQFIKPNQPKPDDTIKCTACGREYRVGDLQQAAVEAGKDVLRDAFSDALGKLSKP